MFQKRRRYGEKNEGAHMWATVRWSGKNALAPRGFYSIPSPGHQFNIGMTNLAECLALFLMFFKHILALLGLSPSKGNFLSL